MDNSLLTCMQYMMHNAVNTLGTHGAEKEKKVQIKTHTPHFNDFVHQTIYASIMQPVYISQIPPVLSTKHTLTHLQLAINSLKQELKRFSPTKSCVYQASRLNIRMIKLKPEEKFRHE